MKIGDRLKHNFVRRLTPAKWRWCWPFIRRVECWNLWSTL